jgi:ketosteroid isomerase-like protein
VTTTESMRSPLDRFLRTFDRLDADACAALFAHDGRLRYIDGHVEQGRTAVRECLRNYFADLRSTEHIVHEHWHCDRVWIAEVEARYVLADHSILGPVSKVFVMRMGDDAIEELRVYAAGEPSFHEAAIRHDSERSRGLLVGGRWTLPL